MTEELTAQDGRQGRRGKRALYVLIASTGLMLVALVGFMLWNYVDAPTSQPSMSQAASRKEITGSNTGETNRPSSANASSVPGGNPAYPVPAVRNPN